MSDLLFDRRARLTIRSPGQALFNDPFNEEKNVAVVGIVIEELAIEFDIEHNLTRHPNQCSVKVMNLSEEVRKALSTDGRALHMTLEAGYADGMSVVFTGDVTYVLSSLKEDTWITELQGGDGDHVSADAVVNKSYAPGVQVGNVLEDLFNQVGQHVPDVIKNSETFKKTFNNGIALTGKFKDVIPKLVGPMGYTWSTQHGNPVVLREDDVYGDVLEISEANGMLDSPEFGKPDRKTRIPNVTINLLLLPQVKAGNPVKVTSRDLNGTFKVVKVKHTGHTHGENWFTQIEVKPVTISATSHQKSANSGNSTRKST